MKINNKNYLSVIENYFCLYGAAHKIVSFFIENYLNNISKPESTIHFNLLSKKIIFSISYFDENEVLRVYTNAFPIDWLIKDNWRDLMNKWCKANYDSIT